MDSIIQSFSTLFVALGFLLFFGPIIIIVSIIGKLQLGFINIDLNGHSKLARFSLALLGIILWFAVYIPVVSIAYKAIQPLSTPTETATISAQNLQITETPTFSAVYPTVTNLPIVINTPPADTKITDPSSIVITEILGNPCGGDSRNEFIEIYNSGGDSIDVNGWWITDGDAADKIVSWQSRYPNIKIGYLTKINSTEIPPHNFAVILAPGYPFIQHSYVMPYIFPENTVILTVEKGQFLGDEKNGIQVLDPDVIVLYKGDESALDKVISSYGSPILSSSPKGIKDNNKDKIPFDTTIIGECWSVERIFAANEDVESNWRQISNASPGSGDYP